MPIPLLVPLAIAAGAGIAKATATGVGNAKAAKELFNEDQAAELADLEARRKAGELGLTEDQKAAIDARYRSSQAALLQRQQAEGLQQAAAQGGAAGTDLRSMYLARLGQQQAAQESLTAKNEIITNADQQAAALERNQLQALRALRSQAAAARKQAVAGAVGESFGAIGEAAGALYANQAAAAQAAASLGVPTDEELMRMWQDTGRNDGSMYDPNAYDGFI